MSSQVATVKPLNNGHVKIFLQYFFRRLSVSRRVGFCAHVQLCMVNGCG